MMPSIPTVYLIRWTNWITRAAAWQHFRHSASIGYREAGHAQLVASWAKSDYKAWRAATFQ